MPIEPVEPRIVIVFFPTTLSYIKNSKKNNIISAKLNESYLSKKPPCPGKKLLESFLLNFLLIFDIKISPKKPDIAKINENKKIKKKLLFIFKKFIKKIIPNKVPIRIPIIVPDIVFEGLTIGKILGPFIKFPEI